MTKCLNCGSPEYGREFVVTRDDRYMACLPENLRQPARYRECLQCHAMYLCVPNIDLESYKDGKYYDVDASSPDYYRKRFDFVLSLPRERSDNRARVDRIENFLKSSRPALKKDVLDIGAGLGVFIAQFAQAGWSGAALEPDPRLCAHMRSMLPEHVEVWTGALRDNTPSRRFGLITLNRVLEHVKDAEALLNETKQWLSKDGILYVELPDTRSFFSDGPNNEAFGYGHYTVYSPEALIGLAGKSGFEVESVCRVQDPSTKFTIYAFLSLRLG